MENLKDYFCQAFAPVRLRITDAMPSAGVAQESTVAAASPGSPSSAVSVVSLASSASFEVVSEHLASQPPPQPVSFVPQHVLLPVCPAADAERCFLTPRRVPPLENDLIASSLLPLVATALQSLRIPALRPAQAAVLSRVFARKSTLCTIPTSGGKSLIYTLPAVLFGKVAVVVTPTIALREDQIRNLQEMGVNARQLNSGAGRICRGELQAQTDMVLFLTPERLVGDAPLQAMLKAMVSQNQVALVAVDECHLMVECSGFRTDYAQIVGVIQTIRGRTNLPVVGLSASLPECDLAEIQRAFAFCGMEVLTFSVFRPNLHIHARYQRADAAALLRFADTHDQKMLVYARKTATCEELAATLSRSGCSALPFHSRLRDASANAQRWVADDAVRALVATVGFGMGINLKRLAYVYVHDFPSGVNDFVQKIGRGGRSGQRCDGYLNYSWEDAFAYLKLVLGGAEANFEAQAKAVCDLFCILERPVCTWRLLEQYYTGFAVPGCGKCEVCTGRPAARRVHVEPLLRPLLAFFRSMRLTQFRALLKDRAFAAAAQDLLPGLDWERCAFLLLCEMVAQGAIQVRRQVLQVAEEPPFAHYFFKVV
ncbi:ATP-dependent DNA helicase RecQ [Spironucleus salmonicida]|uniref:DNA 3'-5' helicase n=1 Tax=Spironucleus salmonicida TaxID=348837 RepID=V6LKD8_9EUKA|nr:ATP-dependent DNA helicase RecQ [Spironucleus salmonicida]|eukprot:EST44813.1 ATP-dependent DNA helicase RecQ [Spironucleus salmonicida]